MHLVLFLLSTNEVNGMPIDKRAALDRLCLAIWVLEAQHKHQNSLKLFKTKPLFAYKLAQTMLSLILCVPTFLRETNYMRAEQ